MIGAVGAFFAFEYRQAKSEGGGAWHATWWGVRVALRLFFDLA